MTEESSLRNENISHDTDTVGAMAPTFASQPETSAPNENTPRSEEISMTNGTSQVGHSNQLRAKEVQDFGTCTDHYQLQPSQPNVDSEGFTERPSSVDEITRAQREASAYVSVGRG